LPTRSTRTTAIGAAAACCAKQRRSTRRWPGRNGAVGTAGKSFFSVDDANGALVLDTIKRSEDGKGVVLRFYESLGGRGTATVKVPFAFKRAVLCNVLEDESDAAEVNGDSVTVTYAPFQIVSLKFV
jgi:alpha-mannosidase